MDQIDRIKDKAQRLGLDTGDNLEDLATQIGLEAFDESKDLNKLETKIDNLIYEKSVENDSKKSNDSQDLTKDNNIEYLGTPNNMDNAYIENQNNYNPNANNINENNYKSQKRLSKEANDEAKKENRKEVNKDLNKIEEEALKHFGAPDFLAKKASEKGKHGIAKVARNKLADGIYNVKNKFGRNNNENSEDTENKDNNLNQNKTKKVNSPNPVKTNNTDKADQKESNLKKLSNSLINKDNKGNKDIKEAAKDKAKTVTIQFIKKHPMVLLIIAALLLILLIILMVMGNDDSSSGNYNAPVTCDSFPMKSTSLTRDEFIESVTNYLSSSSNPGAAIFIENAGLIYDKSRENNVNPELVIIRSYREGFSPSGSRRALAENPDLALYNNYYGMGCNNTGDLVDCVSYENFEEGLLDFLDFVDNYNSIYDMMARYSSLGSYWYNPGGSGLGGCHYLNDIREYLPPDRISVAESACAEGNLCDRNGGGSCVATTEEDRKAYTEYQVQSMIDDRKAIFGLEPEVCYNFSEGCVIYGQSDPRWADKLLGNSNADMGNYGCAVTSIAIGISCSGVPTTIPDFDAGKFLDALNEGNCFDASGGISSWSCLAITEVAPNVSYLTQETGLLSKSDEEVIELINKYDPNTTFIILHYNHEDRSGGHFIVYSGISGENFLVKDPAHGGIQNNVKISKIDRFIVYSTNNGV